MFQRGLLRGRHSGRGFTLIELLVVIAIIAILMALLVPLLAYARRKSRETATLANIKNIRMALENYSMDNGGIYPVGPAGTGQVYDNGSGPYNPGFYQTHCASPAGTLADGLEDNSALTKVLVDNKYLVVGTTNINAAGSFMDYFGKPLICRFMVMQSVDGAGNLLSDKLTQKNYVWSYGVDHRNWINAMGDYVNAGLPKYDGSPPSGATPGTGEVGNMEQAPLPQDDNLVSWR